MQDNDQDNNQDNNDFSDEEYHFNEEEIEESYPTEKLSATAQLADLFKGKKVLTVLGVIIIVYFSYKLLTYITKPNQAQTVATPEVQVVEAPEPELAVVIPQKETTKLDQRYLAAIQSNQQKITNIEEGLDNTNNIVYNMLNNLKSIENKISQLQSVFAEQIVTQQSVTMRKQRSLQQKMNETYQVYAVIPNRAWLQDSKGGLLTVGIGSTIPGAGRVIAINPIDGVVTTDKNISIFYQY